MGTPTWDETFMAIAGILARRSKDPRTKVGAVIVSPENRILSVGYNGTPRGVDDADFPWDDRTSKHRLVIHAERNAVLNYRGLLRDLQGARVYVTHRPCPECLKELVQVGVAEVQFLHDYRSEYEVDLPIAVKNFTSLEM